MTGKIKTIFARAREVVYLDTAAEGLPLPQAGEALSRYFTDKSLGSPGRVRLHEEENAALRAVARLLGTELANVALLASASDALNAFTNSIAWKPGDEVVVTDLEFPSGVLTWLRLRERGVRLRVIRSVGGVLSLEDFVAAIGPATRVVCTSHVSYKTGTRIPYLHELSEIAHRSGAMLVLDATQSLGRLPVPVETADFLVASTYKWLLGIHGLAVTYVAPRARAQLTEGVLGWYSVSNLFAPERFDRYQTKPGAGWMMSGMPNFPAMYVLRKSIEFLLQEDIARVDRALAPVVLSLREGVERLGFELLTPSSAEYASGIVSFLHPACSEIAAELERAGVIVWAGDGRVRASVHLYNNADDVTAFLNVLESISKGLACTIHP